MSPACVVQGLAWGGLANPTDQGGQLSPSARPPSFITCVTGSGQPGLLEGPCGWSQPGGLGQAQQEGLPLHRDLAQEFRWHVRGEQKQLLPLVMAEPHNLHP